MYPLQKKMISSEREKKDRINTTNNFWVNNKNNRKIIYEYEAPVISYKNYKGININ